MSLKRKNLENQLERLNEFENQYHDQQTETKEQPKDLNRLKDIVTILNVTLISTGKILKTEHSKGLLNEALEIIKEIS